ncbi:MAG: hypothetical protein AVDCRST_MAG37-3557 [uncultured Rubrobacteraceae bacterium]|uniref:GGDEF domain-containing protein n=1 Tax=uncultured Rubrobacteraceae bacterium TaxID=349277 RepID=A0A6J4QZ64_9ACTN|nr:MAG: hypothetical protein AVDCRST_MAG37-3557 [uncultured Rubrobacteraceae bacterium]
MSGRTNLGRNAQILKGLSLLYVVLVTLSLFFVHGESYRPAVSYVLLYLAASVIFTAAMALLLLPVRQFGEDLCVAFYVLYAMFLAGAVFFTGGASSELYALFFPLILASALHGSWGLGLTATVAVLVSYSLAVLPDALRGMASATGPAPVFFKLAVFALTGVFGLLAVGREAAAGTEEEGYELDKDGSILLGRLSGEIEARKGAPVGVILVDPGRELKDVDLLLERVRARIEDPILLGEGTVFGLVLGGSDDSAVESAARRALATAGSLGSEEARAGAAVYPRDARSAEDLLAAAGRALEAAFAAGSPAALVLAGGSLSDSSSFRAAR